jgi:chemotaxis protein methyltransferase CheR
MSEIAQPNSITPTEFATVSRMLYELSGINLQPGKEGLVQSRLSKRIRALQLNNISDYLKYVEADTTRSEITLMVDMLTTNKTSFFRESAHFDFLRQSVIPKLLQGRKPIRIWSAACSTGEEPYCISIVLREALPQTGAPDLKILATDISTRVLAYAREAVYEQEKVRDIPPALLQKHFTKVPSDTGGFYRVGDATRAPVRFAYLNLMERWPMNGPFDVIFCRNVMIYFDRETQARLIRNFAQFLAPGGHLLIGHSETIAGGNSNFRYIQPATYERI